MTYVYTHTHICQYSSAFRVVIDYWLLFIWEAWMINVPNTYFSALAVGIMVLILIKQMKSLVFRVFSVGVSSQCKYVVLDLGVLKCVLSICTLSSRAEGPTLGCSPQAPGWLQSVRPQRSSVKSKRQRNTRELSLHGSTPAWLYWI